jgi:hypothetical protein
MQGKHLLVVVNPKNLLRSYKALYSTEKFALVYISMV